VQLARSLPTTQNVLHIVALTDMSFSAEEVDETGRTALMARSSPNVRACSNRDGMGRTALG
jgi:hypothetical protein